MFLQIVAVKAFEYIPFRRLRAKSPSKNLVLNPAFILNELIIVTARIYRAWYLKKVRNLDCTEEGHVCLFVFESINSGDQSKGTATEHVSGNMTNDCPRLLILYAANKALTDVTLFFCPFSDNHFAIS